VRDIRTIRPTEEQRILVKIRKALRHELDTTRIESFRGRHTPLQVKLRAGQRNEELVIDLGAANGPDSDSADSEELSTVLIIVAADIIRESGFSYPCSNTNSVDEIGITTIQ
jgi:hypothetical protein